MEFTCASVPLRISSGETRLRGVLELPPGAAGVVLFTQGNAQRGSPPGDYIASQLRRARLATLLLDPRGRDQRKCEQPGRDIALQGGRLAAALDWLAARAETRQFARGLFASGSDTAAALQLASGWQGEIAAVVSSGGRPDLAGPAALARVRAPTLLIVGEQDGVLVELNRQALDQLSCEKDLAVIRGATSVRQAPDTLEEIARLTVRWFKGYFGGQAPAPGLNQA